MVSNDKGNHRDNGRSFPHRMKGLEPTLKHPFRFNMPWDKSEYFVVLRNRMYDPRHKHHPQLFDPTNIPFSSEMLTENQVDAVNNIIKSTCNKASSHNILFTKLRQYVSHVTFSFLHRNQSSTDAKIDKASDISRMLSNSETSREIKYMSLSDVPMSDSDQILLHLPQKVERLLVILSQRASSM